jgi:hypothetical protein
MGLEPAEIARRALRIISLLRNRNELQRAFVSNEQLNTKSDTQTYTNLDEGACPVTGYHGESKNSGLCCAHCTPDLQNWDTPEVVEGYYRTKIVG